MKSRFHSGIGDAFIRTFAAVVCPYVFMRRLISCLSVQFYSESQLAVMLNTENPVAFQLVNVTILLQVQFIDGYLGGSCSTDGSSQHTKLSSNNEA